jgi:hypothetical protein
MAARHILSVTNICLGWRIYLGEVRVKLAKFEGKEASDLIEATQESAKFTIPHSARG